MSQTDAVVFIKKQVQLAREKYHKLDFLSVVKIYQETLVVGESFLLSKMAASSATNCNMLDLAEQIWIKLMVAQDGDHEILGGYGVLKINRGLFQEAVILLKNAINKCPFDNFSHLYHLGLAYEKMSELTLAENCYRSAIDLNSAHESSLVNLANILKRKKKYLESEVYYRRALSINPRNFNAMNNIGVLFLETSMFSEGINFLESALKIEPDSIVVKTNLACLLGNAGRHTESISLYQDIVNSKPKDKIAWSNLLFAANYHPELSGEQLFAFYEKFGRLFGVGEDFATCNHPNNVGKIKIGYVYSEFTRHSSRSFLLPLIENHDKKCFELYAYSDVRYEDGYTKIYRNCFDFWRTCYGMSDKDVYEKIVEDGIDILVDVAGHTAGNRLPVFAMKPAPVSVHWLDFGYTTGLKEIDYYLTDWKIAPEGAERFFSEKLWRLPSLSLVYRPPENIGEPDALPAISKKYITFGSLSRAIRLNDRVISAWSNILKGVPNSRLVINSRNFVSQQFMSEISEKFESHGIDRERLLLGFDSPPWDVLRGIDICLDCFPHNSGTTLIESLYFGVPYITLYGRPSVGTLGGAILSSVGLDDLIALDIDSYIKKAIELACDIERLKFLRENIRTRMLSGMLTDELYFARIVENAYREMIFVRKSKR